MTRRNPQTGIRSLELAVVALLFVGACAETSRHHPPDEARLAPFVGTPEVVVAEMLRLAAVGPQDVEFRLQDVLAADLSPATVVTLYLSPEATRRVVDQWGVTRTVYLWRIQDCFP